MGAIARNSMLGMPENKEVTYIARNGSTQTLVVLGRPLTAKREKFCQLVAFGALPLDALVEAYERGPIGGLEHRRLLQQEASNLLLFTDVRIRIQELRRPIQRKLRQKWEYSLDKALEDCQTAWDLAYDAGDSKAMLKCIELRGKLTKILTDEVNVHHTHGLLDKETTEVLLAMKEAAARKKVQAKVIEGEVAGEKGKRIDGPPEAPFADSPTGSI